MALTIESLSVWDIAFRWANFDPDRYWLRLPFSVKDNFRVLFSSILRGEIVCETLTLAKLPIGSKADPRFYIRTHIDEIHDCIHGHRYNRKLLKWAALDRMEFYVWSNARGIPLPEFWFPPGWKLQYEIPEGGATAIWAEHVEPDNEGNVSISYASEPNVIANQNRTAMPLPNSKTSRANQQIKIACQQIAKELWREEPQRTITSVVDDALIQKYGGASYYEKETVRGWVKEVAPLAVRSRRGRPPKKGNKGDKSTNR